MANGQPRHCCATVAAAIAVKAAAVGQQLPYETTVAAHGYRQGPCQYSAAGLHPARLPGDPAKCDSSRSKDIKGDTLAYSPNVSEPKLPGKINV